MIDLGLNITSIALHNRRHGVDSLHPQLWVEPSDMRTLFQDPAGTIPVTGPGQPVGLVLDKSQGLRHGQNVVTNGNFSSGEDNWSTSGEAVIVNGEARIYSSDGSYSNVVQAGIFDVGSWYHVQYTVIDNAHGSLAISGANGNPNLPVEPGRHSIIVQMTAGYLSIKRRSGVTDITLTDVSAREIPGYHCIQNVSNNYGPLLARHPASGIRQNLSGTDDFSGWAFSGTAAENSVLTVGASTAPDGSQTAPV